MPELGPGGPYAVGTTNTIELSEETHRYTITKAELLTTLVDAGVPDAVDAGAPGDAGIADDAGTAGDAGVDAPPMPPPDPVTEFELSNVTAQSVDLASLTPGSAFLRVGTSASCTDGSTANIIHTFDGPPVVLPLQAHEADQVVAQACGAVLPGEAYATTDASVSVFYELRAGGTPLVGLYAQAPLDVVGGLNVVKTSERLIFTVPPTVGDIEVRSAIDGLLLGVIKTVDRATIEFVPREPVVFETGTPVHTPHSFDVRFAGIETTCSTFGSDRFDIVSETPDVCLVAADSGGSSPLAREAIVTPSPKFLLKAKTFARCRVRATARINGATVAYEWDLREAPHKDGGWCSASSSGGSPSGFALTLLALLFVRLRRRASSSSRS